MANRDIRIYYINTQPLLGVVNNREVIEIVQVIDIPSDYLLGHLSVTPV